MTAHRLAQLSRLQRVRYDRAVGQIEALKRDISGLRQDIEALRHGSATQSDPSIGLILAKHLAWRGQKLRVLNLQLARKLAEAEEAKALLKKEFGRKSAIEALMDN